MTNILANIIQDTALALSVLLLLVNVLVIIIGNFVGSKYKLNRIKVKS